MKKINNPFIISGYEGKEYFCDRVGETKQLCTEISNGNNSLLSNKVNLCLWFVLGILDSTQYVAV